MRLLPIAALPLLAACAAAPAPPRGPTDLAGSLETWVSTGSAAPSSRTVRRETPRPPQQTVDSGTRTPASPRHRARPVDLHLQRAPLESALRLLADAADLSIVLGEGLDREITVDLRRVDPLEAMHAIAEAHDVELSLVGRTVVARARSGS